MLAFTDTAINTCPWSAYRDPFVRRVREALTFFETGQLAFSLPNASSKLVEGIAYYKAIDNRAHGVLLDQEREQRKRDAETRAAQGGGRG